MRKIVRTLEDPACSGHYSAQGEKALTERDKMVVTSKDLSFSNSVERSHISPGSTGNFFSCFSGFPEGDELIDYSQRNGARASREDR